MQLRTFTRTPCAVIGTRSLLQNLRLLLLLLAAFFPHVTGQGVFEVKFRRIWNPGGRNVTNQCCSGMEVNGHCLRPCRTYFRVCLRQYSPAYHSDCTFGNKITGVLGSNSFVRNSGNVIGIPIASRWPGSFSLVIEARSEGSPTGLISRNEIKRLYFLPSKQWTNDTHVGKVANVSVSYRVVCSPNQYGSSCSKFCQPRDDKFGHITCDADGSHVCLPGWETLPYCLNPICNQSCGSNGICTGPNYCSCTKGWRGALCAQCEIHPGCVHGSCEKAYDCKCQHGWGGLYCDLARDYCGRNNPCQNGAFCRNTYPGRYRCICRKGYGGINCNSEINECEINPCRNGGSCTDLFGDFSCSCPSGFNGKQCENNIDDCSTNACHNGGTCLDGVRSYSCLCPAGFSGSTCEFAVVKSTNRPWPNATQWPTESKNLTNSTTGGKDTRGTSFNWEEKKTLILPIILCGAAGLCLLVGFIIWKHCRKRPCCCTAVEHKDSEEPNTRTEVKQVDPVMDGNKLNEPDLKHCGAGGTKSRTPDIIINFVPSQANKKNVNSKKESHNTEEKEEKVSREKSRTSLELTDITPEQDLDEHFLPNRCFDIGYWQEVEVEI